MAQQYYKTAEAAEMLGVSEDDIKQMHRDRELHGYRDGADWKFKVEDIESLVAERKAESEQEGDVLLSEVELGQSDPSMSGTVIGMEAAGPAASESDIQLADSDVNLGEDAAAGAEATDVASKVSQFEELDLALEEDLSLDDSQVAEKGGEDSTVDLTGKKLDDDDLVLGGSGAGSDITIGGDSGISLVDPSDSGLSLEEPLDLTGSATESLELGEDDMLSLSDDDDAATELKADDDFLLTPLEDTGDLDDSESGSQVIALDTEGDDAATMIAGDEAGSMAAMLDEDLGAGPGIDLAGAPGMSPMGGQPMGFGEGAPLTQPGAVLPEMPYSIWNILSLSLCVVVLVFSGMFMYDLTRNMWSWSGAFDINSSMMDTILGWFEK